MKAAFIEQPGPVDNIHFGELPLPRLHEHAVLVRVNAVTVNHVDTYIRSGSYPTEIPLPFIIGRDMAGIVEAVGTKVRQFQVGEAVWSNCLGISGQQGTFAEYVAAPEDRLYHLPDGVEPQEAVAVVHSALTAVIGLFSKARIVAGDTLFINGGSSSVGLAVLQIAKASGARVGVTAGSDEKAQWCREHGADLVVDYHRDDVGQTIRDFAPAGLDVLWESTSVLDFQRTIPLMAQHGRLVVVAGGEKPSPFPVGPFYLRNCSLYGFTVTGASVSDLQTCARQINAWLARKTLKARIQTIMPLSEAAEAHRMQEAGGLSGKIVLTPHPLIP